MRVLHTSDWHLGRSFHKEDLLSHQATFIDHLLEVIETERVDVVAISGDIYDRALPPVDAVELANDTFARLAASRARVVATSGNHDSATRLGAHASLIDAAGVHFRTINDRCDSPIVIDDAHGPVAFYGIPYLEPEAVRLPWSLPARSHQLALGEAMRRIRLAHETSTARSVVLAHAFVAGATPSDSERDITVGGVDRVGVDTFAGIDYVALGHLHGAATLRNEIRYSGSPLAYSFSESDHVKGSWLIDLDAAGHVQAEFVAAPVPRVLSRISGDLEHLLTSSLFTECESHWVEATITDTVRPRGVHEQLSARFPHVVSLRFPDTGGTTGITRVTPTLGASPHLVAQEFVSVVRGQECSEVEIALLDDVISCCAREAEQVAG